MRVVERGRVRKRESSVGVGGRGRKEKRGESGGEVRGDVKRRVGRKGERGG